MTMPGRSYSQSNSSYRYGFNGQEKSDDVTKGNYTALYWEYDSRTGRRWNVDPVNKVALSPYCTFDCNPLLYDDEYGDEASNDDDKKRKKGKPSYQKLTFGADKAYDVNSPSYKSSSLSAAKFNKEESAKSAIKGTVAITAGKPGTAAFKVGAGNVKVGFQQSITEIDVVGVRDNELFVAGANKKNEIVSRSGGGINYVGYGVETTVEKTTNKKTKVVSQKSETKLSVPFYSISETTQNGKKESSSSIDVFSFKAGFIIGVDVNIKVELGNKWVPVPPRTGFAVSESTQAPYKIVPLPNFEN